jgi:hypothetical protein
MIAEVDCTRTRDLAAEVALGIAGGEERAVVLAHIAECSDCRTVVAEMSSTVDALLLLAPTHQPPPHFETRVLHRLSRPRRNLVRSRVLVAAAALTLGVLGTGGTVWMATATDRRLAAQYRSTLAEARGKYFRAVAMRDPEGVKVGSVFAYQGEPSWIFGVIDAPLSGRQVRGVVVAEDGRRIRIRSISVSGSRISFGLTLPFDVRDTRSVEIFDGSGRDRLVAKLTTE